MAQVRAVDESYPTDREGKYGSMKTFPINSHAEEESLIFNSRLVGARKLLRDIEQQRHDHLLYPFRSRGYSYVCGIMYVALQAEGNQADTNNASVMYSPDIVTNLRDGLIIASMDRWPLRSCVL